MAIFTTLRNVTRVQNPRIPRRVYRELVVTGHLKTLARYIFFLLTSVPEKVSTYWTHAKAVGVQCHNEAK